METYNLYGAIFNEMPMPVFIVNDDVQILFYNREAENMLQTKGDIYQRRGGDILHCVHSFETAQGCGHSHACNECVIRNAVNSAFKGGKTYKKNVYMQLKPNIVLDSDPDDFDEFETLKSFHGLITASPFEHDGKKLALLIIEDISELVQLRDIIPICANCKKIRDDENYWVSVESYIHDHTDVDFSHSICPDCMDLLYPELKEIKKKKAESQNV